MPSSNKFGPDVKTVANAPMGRSAPHPDTRATQAMSPISNVVPRRRPEQDFDRTAMIPAREMLAQSPHQPPHQSMVEQVREPPEVELVEHHLPMDRVLDPRLVLVAEPDSERAAGFRILRHHLMEQRRPQIIVVSSPHPGEGKTTCAVNLALALSERQRARVLLVEATVQSPQLARIFQLTPPWCFAEQIAVHRDQPLMPWRAVNLPAQSLHVAAIDPGKQHGQLLDATAFSIAMERLSLAEYEHIVIDAPAVLGSAEVNLIQDAADGVLLTARAGRTTARNLRNAVEQLRPTKVIGTVLLQ